LEFNWKLEFGNWKLIFEICPVPRRAQGNPEPYVVQGGDLNFEILDYG